MYIIRLQGISLVCLHTELQETLQKLTTPCRGKEANIVLIKITSLT